MLIAAAPFPDLNHKGTLQTLECFVGYFTRLPSGLHLPAPPFGKLASALCEKDRANELSLGGFQAG
jgi:hypothetical protein